MPSVLFLEALITAHAYVGNQLMFASRLIWVLGMGGDKHLGALGANCSEFVPSRQAPLLAGNIILIYKSVSYF